MTDVWKSSGKTALRVRHVQMAAVYQSQQTAVTAAKVITFARERNSKHAKTPMATDAGNGSWRIVPRIWYVPTALVRTPKSHAGIPVMVPMNVTESRVTKHVQTITAMAAGNG